LPTFPDIINFLSTPKRNLSATTPPTAADDDTKGYQEGSLWADVTAKKVYICRDSASAAAVWEAVLNTPSGVGVDNAIVLWDGTGTDALKDAPVTIDPVTGNIEGIPAADGVLISGQRRFPAGASDPAGPAADGDAYYNTFLNLEMRYDGGRLKWLSDAATRFYFGRSGNTAPGSYFDGPAGVQMGPASGFVQAFSGTVVAMGFTKDPVPAGVVTLQAALDGVDIPGAFLASILDSTTSIAVNADFTATGVEILGVRNSGITTARDLIGWIDVRWRAP
jgi:hypothetical protein